MIDPLAKVLPKAPQRWVLALAVIGILGPLAFAAARMTRHALFPKAVERYDITTLWTAPAAALCPDFQTAGGIDKLSNCLTPLSLAEHRRSPVFETVRIPSLDQVPLSSYPRIETLFEEQGAKRTLDAVGRNEALVMGMRVPAALFLPNHFSTSPNALVFAQIDHARICFLGSCPYYTDMDNYLALQFPLFGPAPASDDGLVELWIVYQGPRITTGLNLEHGLFVASTGSMRPAAWVHRSLIMGMPLIEAALLFGVALMAMLYAVLWAEYLDFTAFAILVGLMFLNALNNLVTRTLAIVPGIDELAHAIRTCLVAEISLGSLFFAIATLRPKALRFWLWWAAAALVAGCVFAANGYLQVRANTAIRLGLAIFQMIAPALLALLGGIVVRRRLERDQPTSKHLATGRRRQTEQLIIAACLVLAATPNLLGYLLWTKGRYTYDIRNLSGIAIFPLFAALLYSAGGKFRSRAEAYHKDVVALAKQAAIGEMVQMLAHDVRKPFSMLRMGLNLLARPQPGSALKEMLAKLTLEVNRSIRAVNGMLEDIMAVSSEPTLSREAIGVDTLVLHCLQDLMTQRSGCDIAFSYDFCADSVLDVDAIKILRVIGNIVDNAIQATNGHCRLWFQTKALQQSGQRWIELTLGNSASYIPPERCARIFDAFYTHGKANGTGLGLAVGKKFVEQHGGSIRCTSRLGIGTEFVLRLPAVQGLASLAPVSLPAHASELYAPLEQTKRILVETGSEELSSAEQQTLIKLAALIRVREQPLRLLLVDDEPIYTAAITALIEQLGQSLGPDAPVPLCLITTAAHSEAALALAAPVDLGIFDVDLGQSTSDGFMLVERLKNAKLVRTACIHSNRMLPADLRRATQAGADSVLPKPMSRSHLLDLLTLSATAAWEGVGDREVPERRELVLIVDDDIFVREAWSDALGAASALTFTGPDEILQWLTAHPAEHDRLTCIIVDLYLEAQLDGLALAKQVRELCQAPLLLSSDASLTLPSDSPIAAQIAKETMTLAELKAVTSRLRSTSGAA